MGTVSMCVDKRSRKDGSHAISLVIRVCGKRYVFPTGVSCPTYAEFDKDSLLRKTVPQYKVKNIMLTDMKNAAEKLLIVEQKVISSMPRDKVKDMLYANIFGDSGDGEKSFIDYLDEFVALKNNKGTKELYEITRKKIMEFSPNCTFESMDRKWLTSFENWMSASGMKINAYAIHLRNIRAVFNYAIDEEITSLYPFRKFKIKKEETRKRSLTVEQLRELRDYPCEPYQERYRDMFMLMFYLIGINAVDLFNAKKLVNGRLEYHRAKTGKLYSIKVESEAMDIINKYKGKSYLLNVMDEYKNYKDFLHRMGIGLKQIGECKRVGLGGKKQITPLFPDISSYWARHTWATIAADLDIPKETISAGLGHGGSSVTDIYIRFDNRKVDDANRRVIDYVLGVKNNED